MARRGTRRRDVTGCAHALARRTGGEPVRQNTIFVYTRKYIPVRRWSISVHAYYRPVMRKVPFPRFLVYPTTHLTRRPLSPSSSTVVAIHVILHTHAWDVYYMYLLVHKYIYIYIYTYESPPNPFDRFRSCLFIVYRTYFVLRVRIWFLSIFLIIIYIFFLPINRRRVNVKTPQISFTFQPFATIRCSEMSSRIRTSYWHHEISIVKHPF